MFNSRNKKEAGQAEVSFDGDYLNAPGFLAFLEKFKDLKDEKDLESIRPDILKERFEIFRAMPQVASGLKAAAKEHLNVSISPEQDKAITGEIEKMVLEDLDFESFRKLEQGIKDSIEIPKQIKNLEEHLATFCSRDALLNQRFVQKGRESMHAQRVENIQKESAVYAEAGLFLSSVNQLEKKFKERSGSDRKEAEKVVGSWGEELTRLVDVQNRFNALYIKNNLTQYSENFSKNLGAELKSYEESLKEEGGLEKGINPFFTRKLENYKRSILEFAAHRVMDCWNDQRGVSLDGKKVDYKKAAQEITDLGRSVGAVKIDQSGEAKMSQLVLEAEVSGRVIRNLDHLKTHVNDLATLESLALDLDNLPGSFKNLKTEARAALDYMIARKENFNSPEAQVQAEKAAAYSAKGWWKKAFTYLGKPERVAGNELKSEADKLSKVRSEINKTENTIRSLDKLQADLDAKNRQKAEAQIAIFKTLDSMKQVMEKKQSDIIEAINSNLKPDSLAQALKAESLMEELSGLREQLPHLYEPEDEEQDRKFRKSRRTGRERTFSELKRDFEFIFEAKVVEAMKKSVEKLEAKNITRDYLTNKLKDFEKGLGADIVKHPLYKKVRSEALEKLAGPTSPLKGARLWAFQAAFRASNKFEWGDLAFST